MSAHSRPSDRHGVIRTTPVLTTPIVTMRMASMSKTSRPTPWVRNRRARLVAMADNPAMRRFRPRWLSALLGGIILPLDPVLGLVLLMVGLWRPKAKSVPKVLRP